jgi:murein DD-endopeptidase MepM/ murein hydrolase activator NlpD
MRHVSVEHNGRGTRAASTRSRRLFALVVFAIGIVPVTEIAKAAGPSKAPACPAATYTVVSGDSWSRIASRAKISLTALTTANAATTGTVIHPGQSLCMPSAVPVAPSPTATIVPVPATAPATPAAKPTASTPSVSIDVFPVQGPCSFSDTYAAPRSGGRVHEGVDVIAKAGQWIYAAKAGTLTKKYVNAPGSLSGNGWRLTTGDGTYFFYAHLSAFAAGLSVGTAVTAGQIIGQVGMTGAAPIPHLHFEVHPGGGASVNPTPVVKAVDGCKNSDVPPQPNGIPTIAIPTTVPTLAAPVPTIPAPTLPARTLPTPTVPAATVPTTTVAPYVAGQDHRRDGDPSAPATRPRR